MTPDDAAVLDQLQTAACPFPWCAGDCEWELEGASMPGVFTRWHFRTWPSGVVLGQAEFPPGTDPAYVALIGQPEVVGPDESAWIAMRLDGSVGPGMQDLDAVNRVAADLLAAVELAKTSRPPGD